MSERWPKVIRRQAVAGGVALLAALLTAGLADTTAAQAEALAPWWGLTSSAVPTSVHPGPAQNEVQELSSTKGEIFKEQAAAFQLYVAGHYLGFFASEPFVANNPGFGLIPATDENLREALESKEGYGTGNVTVSGGPIGTAPVSVTSVGEYADAKVPQIEMSSAVGEHTVKVLTPGRGDGQIVLTAEDLGDAPVNVEASPVVITDKLPAGLNASVAVEAFFSKGGNEQSVTPTECRRTQLGPQVSLSCAYAVGLGVGQLLEERISVVDAGAVSGTLNEASVSGGGAVARKSVRQSVMTGAGEAPFGVENYELAAEEAGGAPDTQAGSHPFQLTTTLTLNQNDEAEPAGALTKDLRFNLPPGLIGNPTPFAQCTTKEFIGKGLGPECLPQTIVGSATITYHITAESNPEVSVQPIYNLVPNTGEPARFVFLATFIPVYLDASVRTGEGYGVTVHVSNISETAGFLASRVTFWGVPADSRHDAQRGGPSPEGHPAPLLSLPTACTGPIQSSMQADSWAQPGAFLAPVQANEPMAELDGCNHLPFDPEISVAPDVSEASSPSGLTVAVHIPQTATLNPKGLAESTLKDTTVTLPEGVAVNPGGADGLEACSEAQIGYLPGESTPENLRFTASEPEPFCPDASKIGTVEIETPLLPNTLKGAVYLGSPAPFAEPGMNPFGSLLSMYIVARDPVSGVLLKLPGQVALDPSTGRLVATFDDTPPLPFENLRLHFFGGARAPLSTPPKCGTYETSASLAPWSGEAPSQPSSTFQTTSGPNGGPCHAPLPFAPELTAGTTSIQAGGFSPFEMTMSRHDGNQNLQAVVLHMPPGLSGTLSTVKLCDEAEANAGTCGPETLIGETTVSVGVGGNPYTVTGGKVYITGPYEGAPFGLSIVNPAKAGPFNLGQVVVRAKIEVNPVTAALTITTDDNGPYRIPTILHGIPLQIQHINVSINRPDFTFNPTNCSKLQITGTLFSTEESTDQLTVPFQATNCAVLSFQPHVSASTAGKTSRADGASLKVNLSYTAGPYDTNISKFKIELPKQLPSRLSTLQKACPDATFESNPAACPVASMIGHAHATTPLVPVALEGPMYFVSHGGAKFPEVIVVLQGYGVTIDLHGETFINKAGVTSSTFATVPDAPVGTFEANLPEGPDSALAANGTLCKSTLTMPTEIVAQNGAQIKQDTKIAVTGCKPALTVIHHKAKGKKATLVVSVPSAGQLLASAAGLSQTTTMAKKAGAVTVNLNLSNKAQAFLAHDHGRQLAAHITLRFNAKNGEKLDSTVMVLLG
jgi:hypothetical protein